MSFDGMKPLPLTLIVAATRSNAIGRDSALPWRLSKEMAYFARMTKGEHTEQQPGKNAVIMGRKSWEGIPTKFRPLAGRVNVVVTRQNEFDLGNSPQTHLAHSLESAVEILRSSVSRTSSSSSSEQSSPSIGRTFLIGGAQLYDEALKSLDSTSSSSSSPYSIDRILLTRILTDYPNCDTFLHPFTEETARWRKASYEELRDWAGWEVPQGLQREKDRAFKGNQDDDEKIVEYEFQMWVKVKELSQLYEVWSRSGR